MENQNPITQPVILDQVGNSESSNPGKPKPKFPLAAIIGIILLLLIVGVSVGFYVFKAQKKNLSQQPATTNTIKRASPSLSFQKDKVYQNIKRRIIETLK